MISYHKGYLLESQCDIIAHQVNLQGVMGGGLARQIAEKYPQCEEEYKCYCKDKKSKIGKVYFYMTKTDPIIANCFSQEENFDTNYEAVKKCFEEIKDCAIKIKCKTIGVPVGYGSTIANGNKEIIEKIINNIFIYEKIELQWWKYDKR